jgi:hypothetical protein
MTETHDLVTRLLAAIEATEQQPGVPLAILRQDLIGQAAARIARWVQPPEAAREVAIRIADAVMPADATDIAVDREAVLRGCAADRKTIKDWQEADADIGDDSGNAGFARGLYRALERLAEGYGLTEQQEGQP